MSAVGAASAPQGRLLHGWLRRRSVRLLAALLSGGGLSLTLPPFDFVPALAFYSALLLILDAADRTGRRLGWDRALCAAAFGFGYHLAGLWWVGAAFLVDADTFAALLPLGVIGLPLGLSVFHGLAGALVGLAPRGVVAQAIALAVALSFSEWLRAVVLTGFPWNSAGIGLTGSPLMTQGASLVGTTGLVLPAALLGSLPVLLLARPWPRRLAVAGVLLMASAMALYGMARLGTAPALKDDAMRVRVVQPSVPQRQKWDPAHRDEIWRRLIALTAAPPDSADGTVDLVVWPETAIPFLYRHPSFAAAELAAALHGTQGLVTGVADYEETDAGRIARNSILAVDASGVPRARYHKLHLVPFGEYLPAQRVFEAVGLRRLVAGAAAFEPGIEARPIGLPGLPLAEPLICYEVIFSGPGLGSSVQWIVNVTNDAWFGDTPGPRQHLRHAQLRAVERGLPVVRAANTGISAVIDAQGDLRARLALNERGIIDAPLPSPRTALYNRIGDGPLFALWVAAFAVCVYRKYMRIYTSSANRRGAPWC